MTQNPFSTTELEKEILKECKKWYNDLDGEMCGSDLSARQLWEKAIELTSQRLKAEVEKIIDEYKSVCLDENIMKELKQKLGLSQEGFTK